MEARCNSCILGFAQSAYSDRERARRKERGGVEWRGIETGEDQTDGERKRVRKVERKAYVWRNG
jgi:hypothetical protein